MCISLNDLCVYISFPSVSLSYEFYGRSSKNIVHIKNNYDNPVDFVLLRFEKEKKYFQFC